MSLLPLVTTIFCFVCLLDINECNGTSHGCSQICTNTMGSYYCSCRPGYNYTGNGQCQDNLNYRVFCSMAICYTDALSKERIQLTSLGVLLQ